MTRWTVNHRPCVMTPMPRIVIIGPAARAASRDSDGTKAWRAGSPRTEMPKPHRTVKTPTLRSPSEKSSRTPSESPAAAFSLIYFLIILLLCFILYNWMQRVGTVGDEGAGHA